MLDPRSSLLRALLEGYSPTRREADAYDAMLGLLDSVAAPFDRDLFEPGHFTASGLVLAPDRRSVLLVHHRRLERWLQPGGHIDPGDDSASTAAQREVGEETGVARLSDHGGLLDVDVHWVPARGDEPRHRHFDLRFGYVAVDEVVTPAAEVYDARWVEIAALDDLGLDASSRRALDKLLR